MSWRSVAAHAGLAGCVILVGAWLAQGQIRERIRTIGRASFVMGASVQIESETAVGKVVDLVINDDGCIDYLVVGYEERFVPIPWSLTTVEFDRKIVMLDITKERWEQAPSFTGQRWEDLRNEQFTGKVRTFFDKDRRRDSGIRPERRRESLPRDQGERRRPPSGDRERSEKEPAKDKAPQREQERPSKEPAKDKVPQREQERPDKEPAKKKPSQPEQERPDKEPAKKKPSQPDR